MKGEYGGGAKHTEFNPERGALADAGRDAKPSATALDYLPDEGEAKTRPLSTLLLPLFCLIKCRCVHKISQYNAQRKKKN